MCGRFTQDLASDDLIDLYGPESSPLPAEPCRRWNGAPTQDFAVCRMAAHGRRELTTQKWGLVPAWSRDAMRGPRLINARSETVDSKPSFRAAFRHRRCLVPANGWFEWQACAAHKQPWWISLGGELFSFAALWETWGRGRDRIDSFAVLTCPADSSMQWLHPRQPVIVARDRYGEWLDPAARDQDLLALARVPPAAPSFEFRKVGAQVNNARNDFPALLTGV